MNKLKSILFVIILFIIILISVYICINFDDVEESDKIDFKVFVISMKNDTKRLNKFDKFYKSSDLSIIPYEIFTGIDGKLIINLDDYINQKTFDQIMDSEKKGYRTKHYELTLGGIGCYLSHLNLYYKLINDPQSEYYIIFEDDASLNKKILKFINYFLNKAPYDWDFIIFGAINESGNDYDSNFIKYTYFWGLNCYIVNKKGAMKFIKEFEYNKIKMQIDSAMSKMALEKNLNIYGTIKKLTRHDKIGTNIQLPLKIQNDIDPFDLYN
jgi:GR25 family glycosyltransferase involved in LPS biosynthesis